ncbi:MAG: LysM peptidoglycan-binding domain-containing protein, partial [Anaerolineae bacterium]|nr:LysM peptidoglycan-binding domain-containing protein [Anaerolineae bacterium]
TTTGPVRPAFARPRSVTVEPPATPSPTATPQATATPVPTPIRHKVAAGESFGLIADKYGRTAKEVAEANGMTVNDMIYPGQELIIPPPKDGSAPLPTPTPTGGTLIYTVRAGDTLSEIAERFDSRVDWILEANRRKLTDMLRPGDRLLIPLSSHTPTPTPSPTPTISPTPSPTSEMVLRPPILLAPAHQAIVSAADEVILRWAASAVLAKDQWYVVTVRALDTDAFIAPHWTKSTQWRFPAEYRDPGREATRFSWQVQVFVGEPGREDGRPVSPPSEERSFTWKR